MDTEMVSNTTSKNSKESTVETLLFLLEYLERLIDEEERILEAVERDFCKLKALMRNEQSINLDEK